MTGLIRIVTGVRIRMINRILYLQIQQGVLGSDARVNSSTVSWKKIDTNISRNQISIGERGIALTSAIKEDSVVTGLRISRCVSNTICLETLTSDVNVDTVQLEKHNSVNTPSVSIQKIIPLKLFDNRIYFQVTPYYIPVENNQSPIHTQGPSVRNIRNGIVYPKPSGGATKTAIPYFDAQDVVTNPPRPLRGVGLYFKASLGSGGFVAPLIYPHLNLE